MDIYKGAPKIGHTELFAMFRHRRLVKPGLFPVSMELNTSMDATW